MADKPDASGSSADAAPIDFLGALKGAIESSKKESGAPVSGDTLERFVLVAGMPGSGKSTLLSAFLSPGRLEEAPKPTIALEYTFGRRSTSAAVVTVDVSRPAVAVRAARRWLEAIRARATDCLAKLRQKRPKEADAVEAAARARDRAPAGTPVRMPVPVFLVATKYDLLARQDPGLHRIVLSSLRAAAVDSGAAMLCFSRTDRGLLAHARAGMARLCFGQESKRIAQLDAGKPVIAPFGADSAEAVGPAPEAGARGASGEEAGPWVRAVDALAPMPAEQAKAWAAEAAAAGAASSSSRSDFDDEPSRHPEPSVDALRMQRATELERYVKDAERRLRQEARAAAAAERAARGGGGAGGRAAGASAGKGGDAEAEAARRREHKRAVAARRAAAAEGGGGAASGGGGS